MKRAFSILVVLFFVFSCSDNDPIINPNNLLLGNWSHASFNGGKINFKRVQNLPNEDYGISFKTNNIFLERSSGWCGTPPLLFTNSEGTWQLPESELIDIHLQNFPGNFNWKIILLDENELIVERVLTEQEIDHRNLMDLFYEIENLSSSVSCTNAGNWSFTAYGSRACGGPQGYIPYSNQINTVDFLQKVEDYTEAERLYNIKWNIVSTCDVPNTPISIECQNGYPFLKY